MGVSKNRETPQNGWFIMETLLKWMIWGYHRLRKHPYWNVRQGFFRESQAVVFFRGPTLGGQLSLPSHWGVGCCTRPTTRRGKQKWVGWRFVHERNEAICHDICIYAGWEQLTGKIFWMKTPRFVGRNDLFFTSIFVKWVVQPSTST